MCACSKSTRIGDYVVLKTLGTGATGKVKLARHVHTGQYVALKIVRNNILHANSSLYEKVRREIAVLKLIAASCRRINSAHPSLTVQRHIGLMQLLDVYHYENAVVLVLEYCHGGELFDLLLRDGCLSTPVVLDYFQQLVHALDFCHQRGICHRDLKLENILLTHDNHIKIVDFGMATLLFPNTFLHTCCGSPQYCAPEVLRGDLYEGNQADVWSLGVILFVMTTGGLPFDDDNLHSLMAKIRSGAFYMPPEVPKDVAEVIRMMLITDPSQRATLHDVKQSAWFNSHPCREDVFVEPFLIGKGDQVVDTTPVRNPDAQVLKHLAELGLGNVKTIQRRLENAAPCRERQFYHMLYDYSQQIRSYHDSTVDDDSDRSSMDEIQSRHVQHARCQSSDVVVSPWPAVQSSPRLSAVSQRSRQLDDDYDDDDNDNDNGDGDGDAEEGNEQSKSLDDKHIHDWVSDWCNVLPDCSSFVPSSDSPAEATSPVSSSNLEIR